ncbi:MAG TPA: type II toxin-antitoxin system RelE/ParE family toxin [Candidatus Aphodovivens excrementavium]|nr:type II toxin-antitoxin system RelE/ParE family toxin [Candidatus Aphodovivens excrementavium]
MGRLMAGALGGTDGEDRHVADVDCESADDEGAERVPLEPNWRPRAAHDVESAVVYVGEVLGKPKAAKKLYEDIIVQIEQLRLFPELGRLFSDSILEGRGYRSFLVGRHRIFYSFDEEALTIWRVVHVRQDIDDYALADLLE